MSGRERNTQSVLKKEYAPGVGKEKQIMALRNGVKEKDWREQQGVCHFCDRPAKPGYKVCEEHYQMNIEKLKNEKCKEARKRLGKDNEKFFLK